MRRRHGRQTAERREGGRVVRQRCARWFGKPGINMDSSRLLSEFSDLWCFIRVEFMAMFVEIWEALVMVDEEGMVALEL